MTSLLVRCVTPAVAAAVVLVSCLPDGTGTSSSSGGGGGGGVDGGAGDGAIASDGAAAADSGARGREGLCAAYAAATAACCNKGTSGTCSTNNPADWNAYCLTYARACTGMPTCFSTAECNTLIYCSGSC